MRRLVLPLAGALVATVAADLPVAGAGELDGNLTVYAAVSLTESFEAIEDAFAAAHPGVGVTFNFAASSYLATQIIEGAPADVFASADVANIARTVDAGAVGEPQTFATNTLAIVAEAGNPHGIAGLADLADPDLIVVSSDSAVPVGAYTDEVLSNAGVSVEFSSYEENARAIAAKVLLGEADAGIVYRTDIAAAGDHADGIEIPAEVNVIAEYPIATTTESGDAELAAAFVEFVLGDDAQAILADHGFGPPDAGGAETVATRPS